MERNNLISLALSFTSFLIDRINVKSVILFGSVSQGTFDKESDIDIFIETAPKNKERIKNILELYKKTKEYEKFRLSGIENEISIKCGILKEWKSLERSIISEGIVLYGNYQGKPDGLKHKILFILNLEKIKRSEKVKIWRKLYGYKQKVGKKIYNIKGIVQRKIGRGAFLSSIDDAQQIINYLRKNKIKASFFDVWLED